MRNSIRLQSEATEAQQAELARDKARDHANIDSFRELLTALEEGRNDDLKSIDSFSATMKAQVNRRHDALAAHIRGRIADAEAHLRDLDGHQAEAETTAQPAEAENVEELDRRRKKA